MRSQYTVFFYFARRQTRKCSRKEWIKNYDLKFYRRGVMGLVRLCFPYITIFEFFSGVKFLSENGVPSCIKISLPSREVEKKEKLEAEESRKRRFECWCAK